MELIEQLVAQLGVTTEQAEGGAGALFRLAQEKLSDGDFSQVANLIPGLDELIGKAPAAPADGGGGLMGALGGMAEAAGLGDAAGKLGDLSSLTAIFESLGLDAGMITGFISAVIEFLQSNGGESIVAILQGVLK
ncbi:MAG: DUF2780 domain-containing protein [Planctomycetota bacterium]